MLNTCLSSTVTGCVPFWSFASLVFVPVGITSEFCSKTKFAQSLRELKNKINYKEEEVPA